MNAVGAAASVAGLTVEGLVISIGKRTSGILTGLIEVSKGPVKPKVVSEIARLATVPSHIQDIINFSNDQRIPNRKP